MPSTLMTLAPALPRLPALPAIPLALHYAEDEPNAAVKILSGILLDTVREHAQSAAQGMS